MDMIEFYREIVAVQTKRSGLTGLARALMDRIQKPIIITDARGFVHTIHCPLDSVINSEEYISLPSNVLDSNTTFSKGIFVLGGQKQDFACWSIGSEKAQGYLLVLVSQAEITKSLSQAAELVSLAALVELTLQQVIIKNENKYKDEFIRDLVFGNFDSVNEIQKIGKLWNCNFALPYVVMVLEPVDKIGSQQDNIFDLRDPLERDLVGVIPGSLVGVLGDVLVALVQCRNQERTSWKTDVLKAYHVLIKSFKNYGFHTGIGKIHGSIDNLYRGYQQAKVALELGKMVRSTLQPVFFDELGAVRLFYNLNERDLTEFFEEVLEPLEKYDRENNGQLLQTLWHYLAANCEAATVARKLFIHRNTLTYRLQKIEKLLGVNLGDQEKRFNIHAALKVASILGKVNFTS